MAGRQVHIHARLQGMALIMVLGLLPGLLEPLETLLLALLLRLPLQLVLSLLRILPPSHPSQVGSLERLLLQGQKGLFKKCYDKHQFREIQEYLLPPRVEKRR